MISVSGVSMRFGSKVLFEDVTTTFSAGRRYGLTGPERRRQVDVHEAADRRVDAAAGNGRPARASSASCARTSTRSTSYRVIDTVIMGNQRLWAALEERDALYAQPDMTNEDGMRLGELEGIVGEEDGYTAESDAAVLLQGLDIPDALHERTMAELQGGQKVRVLLAQALFGHPEALLLDEPTNHLDLDSIHWLRGIPRPLRRHAHRHLARPAFPEQRSARTSPTSTTRRSSPTPAATTTWWSPRRRSGRRIESENAQREKKIAQLNDFIARFGAGTRASQVTSRRKEVERLQTTELARSNIQRPYIKFAMKRPSGKVAARVSRASSKAHGGAPVISGFGAIVNRGEKIVLVGRNGVGKTTLLKALLADAPRPAGVSRPTSTAARCAGATRCRSATSRRITPARSRRA